MSQQTGRKESKSPTFGKKDTNWKEKIKISHMIHLERKKGVLISTFWPQCHGFDQTRKHLPCTLPFLRQFWLQQTDWYQIPDSYQAHGWYQIHPITYGCWCQTSPELLVPLTARREPRTLSREIVSTATHSLPQACTCKLVRFSMYFGFAQCPITWVHHLLPVICQSSLRSHHPVWF